VKRMFGVLCDRSSTKSSVIIRGKVLSASGEVYGRTASEVAYIYARSAIIDVAQFADSRIDLIASWKYTHTKTAAARRRLRISPVHYRVLTPMCLVSCPTRNRSSPPDQNTVESFALNLPRQDARHP